MKKILKICGISVLSLLAYLLVTVLVFTAVQPAFYKDFFKNAEREFAAPGLCDSLVQQGFSYSQATDEYLVCGYMADGSASRIYITNGQTTRYVELISTDGTPYTGHTGGIAVGETKIWLANDGDGDDNCVWVLDKAEILNPSTESVVLSQKFLPESRAAYCYVSEGMLWVGEFYDPAKYPTDESHHLYTSSGEQNFAFICGYEIDETTETGLKGDLPQKILTAANRIQGVALSENGIVLSQSYSINDSKLFFYKNVLKNQPNATYELNGVSIPVWHLDQNAATKTIPAPPMSEEIFFKDGRLFVIFESASKKYIFGILTRGYNVYSIPA